MGQRLEAQADRLAEIHISDKDNITNDQPHFKSLRDNLTAGKKKQLFPNYIVEGSNEDVIIGRIFNVP